MAFKKGNPGGPGRPSKAEKFKRPIAAAEKQIADRLPELIDNMFVLARGFWEEETTLAGTRRVYKTAPDRASNEYLINRILGKPTERQELSGPDGDDLTIRTFAAALHTAYDNADSPSNE